MDRFPDISTFRDSLARLAKKHQISVPELAEETTDFWILRDQGNTFMRLRKYEDAIKAFDAFIAVMPDESAAFNRAVCLENLERYEEALQTYESFAKRGDIKSIVNIGNCLRALGRKQEAIDYAKCAVALAQDDASCWTTLGNAHFAFENWGEAMKAYATAHQLEPTDPTPVYNLGLAALRAEHVEQAKKAFLAFMHSSMPDDNRRQYVEGTLQRLGEGAESGG
jgi:tetratricopeptide (TPR) repeat protein